MLYSKKLSQFKNLIHGFTTREDGDYREERCLTKTAQKTSPTQTIALLYDKSFAAKLMLPEQVHGDKITMVTKKNKGKTIKGVDGLITKEKGVVLGVTTADCLPLLFYEPKKKIVAAVHVGWKGTFKRVCKKTTEKIKDLGGDLGEVLVAIGPHIKKCCYDIDKKRALMFRKKFTKEIVMKRNDKSFLDLTKANLNQLLEGGLKEKNIEIFPFCTHCSEKLFFSYRKDKENHGEMLSFIGLR